MDFGQTPHPIHDPRHWRLVPTPAETAQALREESAAPPGSRKPLRIDVGCPIWSCPEWVGNLYPPGTPPRRFLREYALRLPAIELNSTFYGVPEASRIAAWTRETPEDFRFFPKWPQTLSHGLPGPLTLADPAQARTGYEFLTRMRELGPRLGTTFLQLPPFFALREWRKLDAFLGAFAPHVPIDVEFRHPSWFDSRGLRRGVFELLRRHHAGAVITDTAGRRDVVHASLPVPRVFVRFLGQNLHPADSGRLRAWSDRLAEWMGQGLRGIAFFVHQADDALAPEAIPAFLRELQQSVADLGAFAQPAFTDAVTGLQTRLATSPDNQLSLLPK